MKCVPKINGVYWLCLFLASIFGANVGDYLSDALDLGHLVGLPYLALALALVFGFERLAPVGSSLFFWAAIIIVRASATNIGDAFRDFGLDFSRSIPLMVVLMLATVALWRVVRPPLPATGYLPVHGFYWVTMLIAGVLGTVAGDAASYPLGLGNFGAMIAYGVPLAAILAIGRNGMLTRLGVYWFTVVLVRSAGTAAGDLLAHGFFGIGFSTALSGVVFIGTVALAYGILRMNDRRQTPSDAIEAAR